MFAYCNNNPINKVDPEGDIPVTVLAVAVVATVAAARNYSNARYFNSSDGESVLTPTSYSDGSKDTITRKEKLDYVKQQTGEQTYNLNAWRYYNEYTLHEYGWYVTGWADDKGIWGVSWLADRFERADVFPNAWDDRWYVNVGTALLGILGW